MRALAALIPLTGLALVACAPMPVAEVPAEAPDQCRAGQYQAWVGRNRTELPAPPAGEIWRVTCDVCAVTMDYNPRRLNVVYDQQSGVVERVSCG